MRIFIDADDTLNDFREYCVSRGVPRWSGSWYTTPRDTWTPEQIAIQGATNDLMSRLDFWTQIPVRKGAFELLHAAQQRGEVYMLTAYPSSVPRSMWALIEEQKRYWAQEALHFDPGRVIVCERARKVEYATSDPSGLMPVYGRSGPNLLIDDAAQNVAEWEAAGGKAIHFDAESPNHLSMRLAIEALKRS